MDTYQDWPQHFVHCKQVPDVPPAEVLTGITVTTVLNRTLIAQMLGVKTSTVHAWLSRKEMRAIKVGHRRYITLQNIKDFREQRKTGDYVDYTYANGPVR